MEKDQDSSGIAPENTSGKPGKSPTGLPGWALKLGKLMIVFAILGCILLATGAFLIGKVLDNALAPHGF